MNIYVLQFSQNVRITEYFDRNNFKILVRKISDFLIMLQTIRIGANHAMQSYRLPRLDISKCKHSKIDWGYHKITFNSQKAKIWAKAKSFDQFHEN